MHATTGTGRIIAGRYRLTDPIGRGAMGTVWRAWDELLDREVAVKELRIRDGLPDDERSRACARTLREARTAARLSHPGVITIYDVAEEDGRPWIVMELVEASSLDRVIESDGPLSPQRAAEAGRQLLGALAAAHAAGVLHRDVKPSNVLLAADGRTVLTDFGIATFEGDPALTQTGMVMGSPGFTAPERIQGNPATPASDLWSLGATLYAAVEGQGPFDRRGGPITIMSAVINEDPPQARAAGALAPVISALLRRNPADRPDAATAARMLGAAVPVPSAYYVPWLSVPAEPGGPCATGGVPEGESPAGSAAGRSRGGAVTRLPGPGELPVSLARRFVPALALPVRGPGRGWRAAESRTAAQRAQGDAGQPGAVPAGGAPPAGTESAAASVPVPTRAEAAWAGRTGDAGAVQEGTAPDAEPAPGAAAQPAGTAAPAGPPVPTDTESPAAPGGPPPTVPEQAQRVHQAPAPGLAGSTSPAARLVPRSWLTKPLRGNAGTRPAARPEHPGPGRRVILALGVCALVIAAAAGAIAASAAHRGSRRAGNDGTPARVSAADGSPAAAAAGPARTGPLPQGFHWDTVPAMAAGTNAGFTIAVPDGWTVTQRGAATYLTAAGGSEYLEVDLTPHTYPVMLTEAHWLAQQTQRQGKFPGYRVIGIRPARIRGADAAAWQFTWLEPGAGRVRVLDLMCIAHTSAGPQSYALYLSAPAPAWQRSLAAFDTELRTFRPVPR